MSEILLEQSSLRMEEGGDGVEVVEAQRKAHSLGPISTLKNIIV
jgi:hypothetical protein